MYVFSESSARDAIVFQLFSFFVWMSENNSNTLYIYICVWARIVLKTKEKNIRFQNIRIHVIGALQNVF